MDIEYEKKREAAYWRERYNILNAANAQLTRQTYDEAEHAFELAQRDIQRDIDAWLNRFADNNGVSLVEARKLLNSDELKELKWDVAEYIKRGRENAISGKWAKELENASARLHISRLEALKIRTQNHLETTFAAENKAVENLVKNVYKSDYYHTCFELQKGFGVGFDISGIDERQLDMLVKKPWTVDRRTFSDRIWERKDKMVSALHQEMIRNCIYGRSRKEMTVALEQFVKKDIKNAEYCAARVIKTETAYFTSQSQRQALSDLDCEMYEVYLPLSPKSCEICREMNGKHFKLSEYVVGSTAPPFHPNCENGSVIPYYEDGFFDDIKGGEKIPEDITYPEWEKKFVKDNGLTNAADSDIIKSNNSLTAQPSFTPAKTKEDAVNYAKRFADDVNFDKVSLANINAINEALDYFTGKYPINKLESITNQAKGIMSANYRTLNISGSKLNSLASEAQEFAKQQESTRRLIENLKKPYEGKDMPWHVKDRIEKLENQLKFKRWGVHSSYDDHIRGCTIHEYGHIVADQYFGQSNKERANPHYGLNWQLKGMSERWEEALRKSRETGDIYKLSQYANTNSKEFFAESFLAREMGEKLPDYVESLMEEVLKNGIM